MFPRVAMLVLLLAATSGRAADDKVPLVHYEIVFGSAAPPLALNFTAAEISAAVWKETNRVRARYGCPPLKALAKLNAAADDQAAYMALTLRTSHDNLGMGMRFPRERVQGRGLYPELVAENVLSMTFAAPRKPPESCAEMAAEFVARWLDSPVHRRNLLSHELTHLGCATRRAKLPGGTERFYSAQVFVAF